MKLKKTKVLSFLMAVCLLPCLAVSCKPKTPTEEPDRTTAEPPAGQALQVVCGGATDYCIVVPEGDEEALSAAYLVRREILKATGVTVKVSKDDREPSPHEILIGKTDRSASEKACRHIRGTQDYCGLTEGEAVAVAGGGKEALTEAVTKLLTDTLTKEGMTVPKDWAVSAYHDYLMITDGGKSDYVIVVPKKDRKTYDLAVWLQNRILDETGVRITVIYDTVPEKPQEILLGNTNRTESAENSGKLTSAVDYIVKADGEKLVFCGKSEKAVSDAVGWFETEYLKQFPKGGNLTVPEHSEHHYVGDWKNPEDLAYSINNHTDGERKKLNSVETSVIYSPKDSWFYSHHQAVERINGRFVAVWSQGRFNEDDCGQRIMVSTSLDFSHWEEPEPLVDTVMGSHSEMVLQVGGIYNNGKQIVVYFHGFEYDESQLRENGTLRPLDDGHIIRKPNRKWYICTEDGIHWGEPVEMDMSLDHFFAAGGNQGPALMDNGELLYAGGGIWNAYTHDLSGFTFDGTSQIDRTFAEAQGAKYLGETSFYCVDGRVYLLCRSNAGELFAAFSDDWGRSWSKPYPTSFTTDSSKFMCGKLPDGRYFWVGNPEWKSNRCPLVIAISEDGINFSEQYIIGNTPYEMKQEGLYKSGHYGYPNCYIGEDGYFYVIYSRGKETVEISRFLLSEIGAGKISDNK